MFDGTECESVEGGIRVLTFGLCRRRRRVVLRLGVSIQWV